MKFNSGTDSIVADTLYFAGTNATNYPVDPHLTRNANRALERVVSLILRSDTTWEFDDANNSDLPIGVADLVAGEQDISIPTTHLKVLKVRVKDTNGNWITLSPASRRDKTDAELAASGTPSEYDVVGSSLLLIPNPNYSSEDGAEVQFQRDASPFATTGTDEKVPGFASPYHRLISLYAALDYTDTRDAKRSPAIRDRIKSLEAELVEFYADRHRDDKPHLSLERTLEVF